MKRYRLRFLLQELELQGDEVVIGRSPDCNITIEDPLVSRRHARIRLAPERAVIEDLSSRNGVKVNAKPVLGSTELQDGDRIRVGSQDLIFSSIIRERATGRPTGFMRVCPACKRPYPDIADSCPHCGASVDADPAKLDDETATGVGGGPRRTWTIQLLGEVIERAIENQKPSEADRLMARAADEVDTRLREGERLSPVHVHMVGNFAMRVAALQERAHWANWAIDLYLAHFVVPQPPVVELIKALANRHEPQFVAFKDKVQLFLATVRTPSAPTDPQDVASLDEIRSDLGLEVA